MIPSPLRTALPLRIARGLRYVSSSPGGGSNNSNNNNNGDDPFSVLEDLIYNQPRGNKPKTTTMKQDWSLDSEDTKEKPKEHSWGEPLQKEPPYPPSQQRQQQQQYQQYQQHQQQETETPSKLLIHRYQVTGPGEERVPFPAYPPLPPPPRRPPAPSPSGLTEGPFPKSSLRQPRLNRRQKRMERAKQLRTPPRGHYPTPVPVQLPVWLMRRQSPRQRRLNPRLHPEAQQRQQTPTTTDEPKEKSHYRVLRFTKRAGHHIDDDVDNNDSTVSRPSMPYEVRKFLLPQLTVGNDICSIERVYRLLTVDRDGVLTHLAKVDKQKADAEAAAQVLQEKPLPETKDIPTYAQRFLRRIFTNSELPSATAIAAQRGQPFPREATTTTSGPVLAWLMAGGLFQRSNEYRTSTIPPRTSVHFRMWQVASRVAGRFAAKEAVIKAFPHLRLSFRDILIRNVHRQVPATVAASGPYAHRVQDTDASRYSKDGQENDQIDNGNNHPPPSSPTTESLPSVSGPTVARIIARTKQEALEAGLLPLIQEAPVSISHDGLYATAVCLGFRNTKGRSDQTDPSDRRDLGPEYLEDDEFDFIT